MPRSIGNTLPPHVLTLFTGEDLVEREGLTFLLLTNTPDGWPHLAMLSVGEALATDERHLRLALWPNSTATGNLGASGRATVALVHQEAGYYIRLKAKRGADLNLPSGGHLAFFEGTVEDVQEDVAPYAVLESGVRFRLKDPNSVLPRWRETVAALRELPAS